MSRRKITPTYRLHAQTGKAIVTVYDADGNRRGVLLPGKFESKESRAEYKRLLLKLNANEGALPAPEPKQPDLAIAELIVRFMAERVITYYVDPITRESNSPPATSTRPSSGLADVQTFQSGTRTNCDIPPPWK